MSQQRHTLLLDMGQANPGRRGGRFGRRPGPIGIALIISALLALTGAAFVVLSPGPDTTPPPDQGLAGAGGLTTSAQPATSTAATPGPTATPARVPTSAAPAATPIVTPTAAIHPSELVSQVILLINQARSQAGCTAVQANGRLRAAAQAHSADMAKYGYLGHVDSKGLDAQARMRNAGYDKPLGENLAQGYTTADSLVQYWLSSLTTGRTCWTASRSRSA